MMKLDNWEITDILVMILVVTLDFIYINLGLMDLLISILSGIILLLYSFTILFSVLARAK